MIVIMLIQDNGPSDETVKAETRVIDGVLQMTCYRWRVIDGVLQMACYRWRGIDDVLQVRCYR